MSLRTNRRRNWTDGSPNVRQTLVKRFPYVVCYVFEEDRVDVIAVFHGHRDPTVWTSRVGQRDTNPTDEN
ncbi:MAG: hypothetical protein J5I93_03615 [Pirellulaceae bacterium]|nr:hypothetical protein [Pirellulaceae bacterium]